LAGSRGIIAAVVAALLLSPLAPVDVAQGMAIRRAEKPRQAPKRHPRVRPKPAPLACERAKFRLFVDAGHTPEAPGADSARNDVEFGFNLRLARLITARLKSEGFAATHLLVTEGKARPSLFKRVAAANAARADFFLSIHHDAVPDKFLEEWEFEGAKSHFSDRFSGHSLFVSKRNPHFATSLAAARLIGRQLKARGLQYATQYTLPVMGRYRHPLLDKDVGVYRYDELVVLWRSNGPAVLLEAGSIINRDEEMAMNSPERQETIVAAVAAAMKEFCASR
jgi:N-acetylmuramoyl-L-alanine amidase